MNILEKIGFGAIAVGIFFAGKYIIRLLNEKTERFNEKATILIHHHPQLKKIFNDYLKNQREAKNRAYNKVQSGEEDYFYDGYGEYKRKSIFGKDYNVYYTHIKIEEELKEKIKELEKDPKEYQIIKEIITGQVNFQNKHRKDTEVQLLELNGKYLKYKDFLNRLFPIHDNYLSREQIITELMDEFNLSQDDALRTFSNLTEQPYPILYEKIEKIEGPRTGKYWYSDYTTENNLKEIKSRINRLTFIHH
ncbi:hypothetical protein [Maribacter sp.]|uniref:hypothetical protein n=1 Tax=Maribacter sp. TaxID=1897614 RepID=UPI0032979F00